MFFSKTSWDLDLGPCSQTQRQCTVRSRSSSISHRWELGAAKYFGLFPISLSGAQRTEWGNDL